MLGTIVNTSTIIAGSVLGSVFRQGIKENYKKALFECVWDWLLLLWELMQ